MAASLSFASLGAGIGVTSVLIYSLGTSGDPHIELTLELASWIRTKRNVIETGAAMLLLNGELNQMF